MNKEMRRLGVYLIYLFSAWSLFRYFIHLPEIIEEVWFKTIIWLVPLFWWFLSVNRRPKLLEGKIAGAVLMGLFFGGFLFGFFVWSRGGVGDLSGEKVLVRLLTALIEQLTFAGLILPLVLEKTRLSSWMGCLLTGIFYAIIHVPIGWIVYRLDLATIFGVFLLNVLVSYVANTLRLSTKNIIPSVMVEWAVLVGSI